MSMHFTRETNPAIVARLLWEATSEISNPLWLLSGGSAISVAVELQHYWKSRPAVALIDERYGPVGHVHSNWQQLEHAGFDFSRTEPYPVLNGQGFTETAAAYEHVLTDLFATHTVLSLCGIGSDGHTAGILPHSPAVTSDHLVCAYETPQHMRITLTPTGLSYSSQTFVYARGEEKRATLEALHNIQPIAEQPAQALKALTTVTVFNDFFEETL